MKATRKRRNKQRQRQDGGECTKEVQLSVYTKSDRISHSVGILCGDYSARDLATYVHRPSSPDDFENSNRFDESDRSAQIQIRQEVHSVEAIAMDIETY